MDRYLTLNGLIDDLLEYKKLYGGNIPVLLSDGDSPSALTTVANTFVVDIHDEKRGETQTVVLLTNMEQDELLDISGWSIEGDDEETFDDTINAPDD